MDTQSTIDTLPVGDPTPIGGSTFNGVVTPHVHNKVDAPPVDYNSLINAPGFLSGLTTLAQYAVLLGNAKNAIQTAAPGNSGTVLTSNGASANPSFQALPQSLSVKTFNGAFSSSTTANNDDTYVVTFTPKLVVMFFTIDGVIHGSTIKSSSGVCFFEGTTAGPQFLWWQEQFPSTGLTTVTATSGTSFFKIRGATAPTIGDNATNGMQTTLSVQTASSTQLIIRTAIVAGPGSPTTVKCEYAGFALG